jgi:hypothetical protein
MNRSNEAAAARLRKIQEQRRHHEAVAARHAAELAKHQRLLRLHRSMSEGMASEAENLCARQREEGLIRSMLARGAGPARIQEAILERFGYPITRDAVAQRVRRIKRNAE